ncbi:MAG TPA: hypothetical protein VJT08_18475 [Terriglobales bacterium]|nr:hypothetical protein [Terriglobales bacterium]
MINEAEDFCECCRGRMREVIGSRLSKERLAFVYHFAFPTSHAEALPGARKKKATIAGIFHSPRAGGFDSGLSTGASGVVTGLSGGSLMGSGCGPVWR